MGIYLLDDSFAELFTLNKGEDAGIKQLGVFPVLVGHVERRKDKANLTNAELFPLHVQSGGVGERWCITKE